MKDDIGVYFKHQDKNYFGIFQPVSGAGSTAVYHLIVDSYYIGRLRFSDFTGGWVVDGKFDELATEFGSLLEVVC